MRQRTYARTTAPLLTQTRPDTPHSTEYFLIFMICIGCVCQRTERTVRNPDNCFYGVNITRKNRYVTGLNVDFRRGFILAWG